MLKFLLCGVLFVILQNVAADKEMWSQFHALKEDCKKEEGYQGHIQSAVKTPTKEGKCFLKCLLIKNKDMKSDGTFDIDHMKETTEKLFKNHPARKERALKTIEECTKEVKPEKDQCETAHKYYSCYVGKMQERKS